MWRTSFLVGFGLLSVVALGCNTDHASLPALSYSEMLAEIRAGKGVALEIRENIVIATFHQTPEAAKQAGQRGTMFRVESPPDASSRAQLTGLCADRGIPVWQY